MVSIEAQVAVAEVRGPAKKSNEAVDHTIQLNISANTVQVFRAVMIILLHGVCAPGFRIDIYLGESESVLCRWRAKRFWTWKNFIEQIVF